MSTTLRATGLALLATSALGAQSSRDAWRLTGVQSGEYRAAIDSAIAHGGHRSARVDGVPPMPSGQNSLSLPVRPDQYRGKRVKMSAYLRTRDVTGPGAYLVLTIIGPSATAGSSDRTALKGTNDWQLVSVVADVPQTAVGLWLNATLNGHGSVWVDDVSLEVVGDAVAPVAPPAAASPASAAQASNMASFFAGLPTGPTSLDFESGTIMTAVARSPLEPGRAVTTRGLDNLVAFARVVGVVRHFHPTEAVRTTNWDDFLIRGVRAVEGAPDADSLARSMTALFSSVAPQVRIAAGAAKPLSAERPNFGDRLAVIYWNNTGLMLGAPNPSMPAIYSSTLIVAPTPDGHLPKGVPSPDSMWTATLPGGVSAVVPTAMWAMLPDDDSARRRLVAPLPAREPPSPNDRAVRIAGVIEAWNVFQHSYPYFDIVGGDWNAELPRAIKTAATDATPIEYLSTLRRLIAAARDGHGNVYPMSGMGRRQYLPVTLDWVENQLVVTQVGPGAPAEIQRGDVIESIDGVKALDALTKREEEISSATPQWRRYRAVNDVMLGDAGGIVNLRLASGRTVRLFYSSSTPITDAKPQKISEIQPGIYYVDIDRITDADFNEALPKLTQAKGVVFDLRGYPRQVNTPNILARLTNDTLRSAHFEVPTFLHPDRVGVTYRDGGWVLPPLQPRITGKIAFITGGGAISYAESTMGIVEQFKLGEIVGGTSAGTNGNVNPFTVMSTYSVAYTGMLVRKRDGSPHHGVGIKPTIPVPRTMRGVTEGRDEALDRAVIAVGGAAIVP